MGDELRGESLVHLNVRFSTETELKAVQDMLYDPQTAGGLLMAVDPADADALLAALQPVVPSAQRVGVVSSYQDGPRIKLI